MLAFDLASLRMLLGDVGRAVPCTLWRSPQEAGGITGDAEYVATIDQVAILPAAGASALIGKLIPEPLLAGGRLSRVGLIAENADARIGDELHDPTDTIYTIEWRGLWLDTLCVLALSQTEAA